MAKRASNKRGWLLLVFIVAPLLPLWRCLLGQAIGPFDQIRQMAPWNGPVPSQPWDALQADGVLQFYVWRDLVFESWGKGQVPFWNPYVLAGTPLLANSQSGALYPPHILFGLLHVPTTLAMFLLAWGHLAWAGLGVASLIRRFGGRGTGAALGGLTFTLSPFMVAWTALPSVISTVSWIPWLLAAIVRTSRAENPRGQRGGAVGVAACSAMMLLAGHLQFVAYGMMASVVVILVEVLVSKPKATARKRRWVGPVDIQPDEEKDEPKRSLNGGAFLRCALALAVGFAIAAPQLLPVLSYSKFSHRRSTPSSDGYQAYVGGSLKLYSLSNLPFPTLTGHPAQFRQIADEAPDLPPVSAYWPQLSRPYAPFAEGALSVGPLVLSLLILAPWRQKRRGIIEMGTIGALALLLALGTALDMGLYYLVPGWSATGSPGRIEVLFVLAACVVAGVSIGRLPKPERKKDKTGESLPWGAVLLPAVVVVPCLFLSQLYPAGDNADAVLDALSDSAAQAALPGLVAAVVIAILAIVAAYRIERPRQRIFLVLSPLLLFVTFNGYDLVRTGDASFLKSSPLNVPDPSIRVAVVNDPWSIPLAAPALAPPNTLAAARLHDLSGYDSLLHRETVNLLKEVDGQDPAPPTNGNMMFVKETANPQRLALAGVTEVWSRKPMPALGEPFSVEGGVARYHVNGPGRASTPSGPARIESESAGQLVVSASGPGRLVVRDRKMPGWSVRVDGKEAKLEGDLWREVDLPAGDHEVRFDYAAPGYSTGLAAFVVGFVALLGAWIPTIGMRKSGKRPNRTEGDSK